MLRKEQNDYVTQTGPGTPMGNLFRSYWIPALLAEELPEADCPPMRVKLLSERLLAFRDSEGKLGLIDEFCAHRGVSLWFGRTEEGGIRCPYHGWKYDVSGQCVDVPSEPAENGFCERIKLNGYPLIEKGGILWTYMGDPATQPPLPEYEFASVPLSQSFVSKRFQECNWLQAMEGGIDSAHVAWLHRADINEDPLVSGAQGNKYNTSDLQPVFEVVESPGGLYIGVRRNAEDDRYYWRVTPWVMPCFTGVPPRGDHPIHGHFWIPIDDHQCWAWSYDFHPQRDLTDRERQLMEEGNGIHVTYVPGTYIPASNKNNNYRIDREAQRANRTMSGIWGVGFQDAALQESMGPVCDRTKENLVGTDNGIIMARHRLMKAAKALAEKGVTPPGVDPAHHRVRQATFFLKRDEPFAEKVMDTMPHEQGAPLITV